MHARSFCATNNEKSTYGDAYEHEYVPWSVGVEISEIDAGKVPVEPTTVSAFRATFFLGSTPCGFFALAHSSPIRAVYTSV